MRNRMRGGTVAVMLIVGLLVSTTPDRVSSQETPPQEGSVRYTDTFSNKWRRGCRTDTCLYGNIYAATIPTPNVEQVDVVVTATLDYRTSPGNHAGVFATLRQNRIGPSFSIDSPSSRMKTSTTLVWEKQGVAAAGGELEMALWVVAKDGPDRGRRADWTIGRNVTVVVELEPSG